MILQHPMGPHFKNVTFFYHHKIDGANQSCPICLLPKLQVLDGVHGYLYIRWVKAKYKFSKRASGN